MTPDQINKMPQSEGAARAAVFADHPLAQQDGLAQSTTGGPTYMSAMQPAGPPTGSTSSSNLLDPWNLGGVSSALGSKVQDVLGAVQNVGGGLSMSGLQPALGSLGGALPDITGTLSPPSPGTPLARVVGGTPIGTLSPTDQAQALMQWNQQYEQARTAAIEGLTGNTPLLSGLANVVTDPEQALALAGGGALGEALLPGAGLLPGIGRQALTGALAGGVYGAGQLSASPSDILGNAAAGAALGGAGGGVAALPGALRGLATPEATQAATDLLSAAPETQFSPRGIAIDPLTGQEMVPAGVGAPVTNNLTRAMAASPDATQFMRTAGNDFVPIVPQAPMQGSDLLTGLQNMVGSRQQDVADTLQQLTDTVNQANAAQPQSEVQAALQGQVDGLRSRLQDLLMSGQATGPVSADELLPSTPSVTQAPSRPANPFSLLTEPATGASSMTMDDVIGHLNYLSDTYDDNDLRIQELENRLGGDVYSGAKFGTGVGVIRPPWAGPAGVSGAWSDRALADLAQTYGQNAFTDLWWEKAGLESGSGELRFAKQEVKQNLGGPEQTKAQATRELAQLQSQQQQIATASQAIEDNPNATFYRPSLAAEALPFDAGGPTESAAAANPANGAAYPGAAPTGPLAPGEVSGAGSSADAWRQQAAINAAFARALGGGALGGLTAYQTTDPNDPNRWLKVAGATGAGAMLGGPYLESALSGGGVVPQNLLEQLRSANLNPNVYQPTARQGVLPQIADVTKQLILSNPATHVGNL